jgi:DNA-binding LytR/AlgR family response regulator
MRVVIIEDEPLAAEKLRGYIERYDGAIEIAATLDSLRDLRHWFRENQPPDLIFSDIELLDGNVFEFFESENLKKPVIFITAYDKFLLRAFELSGIGYLLKPYTFKSFSAVMLKLESLRENFSTGQSALWEEIQKQIAVRKYKERFVIKMRGGIQLVEANRITHFQIQGGILFAFDDEGTKFALSENLNNLVDTLDPQQFFRLNRSEMVNLNFIERLEPYFQNRLVIRVKNSKVKLISSVSRTPELRQWSEGR